MKRRVAVFTIAWAYSLNALWVPGGLDGGYLYSILFPAWHLFALGALAGLAHEGLSNRWPRVWVTLAACATLFEAALALFANHAIGLWLAIPAVVATVLAAQAARSTRLTALRWVPKIARGLALFVVMGSVHCSACAPLWETVRERKISPDGAFQLVLIESNQGALDDGDDYVRVEPRYDRLSLFGHTVYHGKFRQVKQIRWPGSSFVHLIAPVSSPQYRQARYLSVDVTVYPSDGRIYK